MKLKVFSFAFAILLLSNSSFGSISDSAESTTPCTLKKGDLKAITTISGKAIEVLKVNRTYKVEAPNNCSTDTLFLFLNNIRVAKLIPNHGHDY